MRGQSESFRTRIGHALAAICVAHLLCAVEEPAGTEIDIVVNDETHLKVLFLVWTDDLDRVAGESGFLPQL